MKRLSYIEDARCLKVKRVQVSCVYVKMRTKCARSLRSNKTASRTTFCHSWRYWSKKTIFLSKWEWRIPSSLSDSLGRYSQEYCVMAPKSILSNEGRLCLCQFVTAEAQRWSEPRIAACQSLHDSRVEHLQAYDRGQTAKLVTGQNKKLKQDVRTSMTYRYFVEQIITSYPSNTTPTFLF